jgi:cytochrome c553
MHRIIVAAAALALAGACASVSAGDAVLGKTNYAVCAGCHGPGGAGNEALKYPKIAGLDAAFVAQQLHAFKSGARENATMKAITAGLDDADIENVAAYVATLE